MKLIRRLRAPAKRAWALAAVLSLASAWGVCGAQAPVNLTVSAAASLKDAIAEAEANYRQSHASVNFANNFGSSGNLATQIDQGAPADLFLSAAAKNMDDLEAKGLLVAGTRRNLLRNSLVLIAPLDSELKDFQGLANPAVRVIALGDPASVPAGQYGKQSLTAMKLYDKISSKLVLAKDVRQVLTYVETGNADAGLVYSTDAKISTKVRVVATAQDSTHDAILYPAAVVRRSRAEEAARGFLDYLSSPAAQTIFVKYGFTIALQ